LTSERRIRKGATRVELQIGDEGEMIRADARAALQRRDGDRAADQDVIDRDARGREPLRPRGIYRYVRDPFLLTGLVQMWFMPFMTIRLLVLFILSSIYLCLGSLHWEMRLKAQFGEEYEEYRKKVPRFIPKVLNRT
jgi:protein-S-isoprenylcysteine O-methyltransferase Ste14